MRELVMGAVLSFVCGTSVAGTPNADDCWEIFGDFGRAAGEVLSDAGGVRLEADGYTVRTTVRVETGMDARALAYRLAPGEEVALPEVLTYEFRNRLDLDCHRLHAWWNRHYPGSAPRAIYNTWLCRFDKLDADFLLKQVAKASEIAGTGVEIPVRGFAGRSVLLRKAE